LITADNELSCLEILLPPQVLTYISVHEFCVSGCLSARVVTCVFASALIACVCVRVLVLGDLYVFFRVCVLACVFVCLMPVVRGAV